MNNKKMLLGLFALTFIGTFTFYLFNKSRINIGDTNTSYRNIEEGNFTTKRVDEPGNNVNNDIYESVKQLGQDSDKIGNYVLYTEDDFNQQSDKKRVIFFYANWCPTCLPVDKEITKNTDNIPEDVVIFRSNYNDSETDPSEDELAKNYRITYQHTFVIVDEQGNELDKWNGGGLEEILQRLN